MKQFKIMVNYNETIYVDAINEENAVDLVSEYITTDGDITYSTILSQDEEYAIMLAEIMSSTADDNHIVKIEEIK